MNPDDLTVDLDNLAKSLREIGEHTAQQIDKNKKVLEVAVDGLSLISEKTLFSAPEIHMIASDTLLKMYLALTKK